MIALRLLKIGHISWQRSPAAPNAAASGFSWSISVKPLMAFSSRCAPAEHTNRLVRYEPVGMFSMVRQNFFETRKNVVFSECYGGCVGACARTLGSLYNRPVGMEGSGHGQERRTHARTHPRRGQKISH